MEIAREPSNPLVLPVVLPDTRRSSRLTAN
jgi:hypothetical protein